MSAQYKLWRWLYGHFSIRTKSGMSQLVCIHDLAASLAFKGTHQDINSSEIDRLYSVSRRNIVVLKRLQSWKAQLRPMVMKFGLWDTKTTKKTKGMKNAEKIGPVAPLMGTWFQLKLGLILAPCQHSTNCGGGPMAISVSETSPACPNWSVYMIWLLH